MVSTHFFAALNAHYHFIIETMSPSVVQICQVLYHRIQEYRIFLLFHYFDDGNNKLAFCCTVNSTSKTIICKLGLDFLFFVRGGVGALVAVQLV